MRIATGDYIMFVDADDWIDEKCIVKAIQYIQDKNADIVYFSATVVVEDDNASHSCRVHSMPFPDIKSFKCNTIAQVMEKIFISLIGIH